MITPHAVVDSYVAELSGRPEKRNGWGVAKAQPPKIDYVVQALGQLQNTFNIDQQENIKTIRAGLRAALQKLDAAYPEQG